MGVIKVMAEKIKEVFSKKIYSDNRLEYYEREIEKFKTSTKFSDMVAGEKYYEGKHDILQRKREVIGPDGTLQEVLNLPNNRVVDNQYKKMVNQKTNYLLGQPITITSENEEYNKLLKSIFNKKFLRRIKNIGEDSLNNGIAWLYIYYDENGKIAFKKFKPSEIIAGWKDAEHTELEYVIRVYGVLEYKNKQEKAVEKVEIYTSDGIDYYTLHKGKLVFCEHQSYIMVTSGENVESYNWSKIPIIPFKYNNKEIPLIKMVKTLQDGLNSIESNFQNQMEEDTRNTILVLVNYDGENLGEFRKNLATYGAVKVRSDSTGSGDLKTLQVEVNSENYKTILEIFKKAIIENAMGYDAKDDRLSGSPNQMNIQSMYSDIDLDANGMETEFQASFEELLWFVNMHLNHIGLGDFEEESVEVIFNRDMLISESEVIDNIAKSSGIISQKTLVSNHPWIDDVNLELERITEENTNELDNYKGMFGE